MFSPSVSLCSSTYEGDAMHSDVETCLRDAGGDAAFIARCRAREAEGDTDTCLKLLRLHRCELVCALHEAQRPIDVCDWIIHDLEATNA